MYNEQMIQELRKRWNALQQALAREGGDAILITTNVNLFYVSGRIFSGAAYVRPEGDPLFFVRRPVGLKGGNVIYIRKPEEIAGHLQQRGIPMPAKLFLETDSISYNEYRRYEKIFDPRVVCNGTQLLRGVRSIKTIYEIGRIMRSGVLHARLYERIPSLYRPGMTDTELSIEIERESRRLGSLGIFRIFGQSMEIFMGSLLAGDNADAPSPYDFALGGAGLDASLPVGGNGTPLTDGTSVMVDMGGNFTGYMTDMTRVFSVGLIERMTLRWRFNGGSSRRRRREFRRPIFTTWPCGSPPTQGCPIILWDTASRPDLSAMGSESRSTKRPYSRRGRRKRWFRVWFSRLNRSSSFRRSEPSASKTVFW